EPVREDISALRRLTIELPGGGSVPLESIASIYRSSGPNTINRENGHRHIVLQCNVSGRGVVDVVDDIHERVAPLIETLPEGYFVEFGGQFESQQSAERVIGVLFAVAVVGMVLTLYTLF